MQYISFEQKIKILLIIIILGILGIYSITLIENSSFFWDDRWMLLENRQVISFESSSLAEIFQNPYSSQYSPLNTIIYIVIFKLFGLDPFFFHFAFIIVHIFNALLAFQIVYKLYELKATLNTETVNKDKTLITAFGVAFLFGISPMQIEAVAWISASKIILYTFFYFLSILFYLKFVKKNNFKWLVGALIFFILSFLCKEQSVILPTSILIMIYFIYPRLIWRNLFPIIPFFLLAVVFGIISMVIQNQGFSSMLNIYYPFWQRCFLACYSITQYIVKILVPIRQWLFYPFPIKPGDSLPWIFLIYPFIVFVLFYCLVYFFRTQQKIIIFGFFFFLFNLALTLHIIPMGRYSVIADRYTYVSCIGIFIILVDYVIKIWERKKINRNLLLFLCFTYATLTYTKSVVYIKKWDKYWQTKTLETPAKS